MYLEKFIYEFSANKWCWSCRCYYGWCSCVKWVIEDSSVFYCCVTFSSNFGVAKNSSAVLRCRAVRFSVLINLFLDQLVSVSPKLVGPYSGGGGFQVLCSNAKRCACSITLLRVGGFGFKIGVDLVLPGWLDGSLISSINDYGDKDVFLGGCKEFVKLI